jgi:flagellin
MALVINTNISSLISQSQLTKSSNAVNTSIERLSSGLRINSAADDAAGYAISQRMSSVINGLSTAIRNTNDGISYSQTVTGALGSMSNNLLRMRELAVQSANGSFSNSDRTLLAQEYNSLLAENTRIQASTSFNGQNVFGPQETTIQVGYRNNFQDRVNLSSLPLTATNAVSSSMITDIPTTSAAQDIGAAITTAAASIDGSGNSNATYDTVRDAAIATINNSSKIIQTQKTELIGIATNLDVTATSIQSGVNNYAAQLNTLMGSSISPASLTPTSPVNASFSSSSRTAIGSTPTISSSVANIISMAGSASTVSGAYSILQGITSNPYISGSSQSNITTGLASLYQQYQNTSNVSGFLADAQTLLTSPNNVTPSGLTFLDGLNSTDRATEQSNIFYTSTLGSTISNGSYTTISQLTSAINSSINSSSLSSPIKSSLTAAVDFFSAQASLSSTNYSTFKTQLQNLFTNGATNANGSPISISTISSASPGTPKSQLLTAINSGGTTYSSITTAAQTVLNNLYNSGAITGTVKNDVYNAITNLYNQSSTANTLVPTFKTDITNLINNGSIGPFTTSTSYQVQGSTESQLTLVPIGMGGQQNSTMAVTAIDSAIAELNQASSQQGAIQARFTDIISNLQTYSISQSASQSRIQDVDFAKETTRLAKNQILQNSGAAMLSQANASSQAVLSLLNVGSVSNINNVPTPIQSLGSSSSISNNNSSNLDVPNLSKSNNLN